MRIETLVDGDLVTVSCRTSGLDPATLAAAARPAAAALADQLALALTRSVQAGVDFPVGNPEAVPAVLGSFGGDRETSGAAVPLRAPRAAAPDTPPEPDPVDEVVDGAVVETPRGVLVDPDVEAKAQELLDAGVGPAVIADELGLPLELVRGWWKEMTGGR